MFWSVAGVFAKRRLLLALAVVADAALLAALALIAVKLVVDALADGALVESTRGLYLASVAFVAWYLLGQYHRMAFVKRLQGLFRERTGSPARLSEKVSSPRGELVFEDVTFSYCEDRGVLKNVSFHVPAGRTVAVVDVSGSGKSSMVRLLFRLYEPQSGVILLDGVPIADMPLSDVRQAIAVVTQDTVVFHDTIANNIGFGRCGSSPDDIEEAARVAHLHEFILSLPERYETVVGGRGIKLSGGDRQRMAVARAALKRPRVFVFDEATSLLDSKTEQEILRNLLDVASQRTALVIAQRLSTVVHADEILVLDRGVIVERGAHKELCERGGFYAALWQAQQGQVTSRAEAAKSAAWWGRRGSDFGRW